MAQRKVFTDENGKELSYHITSEGKLRIEILATDGVYHGITLDKTDALSFIQELTKIKKQLRDEA